VKKVLLLLAVFLLCLTSFGQKKRADTIAALIDGNSPMEKLFINMGIKKNKKSKGLANRTKVVKEKTIEDTIRVFIKYDQNAANKYLVEIYLSPNNSSLTPGTDINIGIGGGLDAGVVIVSVDSLKSSNGKLEISCVKNKDFNDVVSVKIYYAPREKANETYVLLRKLLAVPKRDGTSTTGGLSSEN